jgi:hypothetical protein
MTGATDFVADTVVPGMHAADEEAAAWHETHLGEVQLGVVLHGSGEVVCVVGIQAAPVVVRIAAV